MKQDEALEILKRGHNVYLTGAAGSGKTYLLNKFIRHLTEKKVRVAVTASTGIAATHMNGITIHAWSGMGILRTASGAQIQAIAKKKRLVKKYKNAEVIVIDEISMLDADRLDLLDQLARFIRGNKEPFGGIQVVLFGDFFQLPPVKRSDEPLPRFAFKSSVWDAMQLKVCYLDEQHRQEDNILTRILNAIRNGSANDALTNYLNKVVDTNLSPDSGKGVRLYPRNLNVDAENDRELSKLPGETHVYRAQSEGIPEFAKALSKNCLAPEQLLLKKGSAVMFVKNNFESGYVNGTLGRVSGFNEEDYPLVTLLNGKKIVAEPATWIVEENGKTLATNKQIPLRLAWAITVHKSQGMTLDAAQVDLRQCFEVGMGYVAFSRVRSLASLKLLGFNQLALKVNEEILSFDKELKNQSDLALREMLSKKQETAKATREVSSIEATRESYPSAYKRWTAGEEDKLVAGFKAGRKISTLSIMLGRKIGGIRSRLVRLGLIEP